MAGAILENAAVLGQDPNGVVLLQWLLDSGLPNAALLVAREMTFVLKTMIFSKTAISVLARILDEPEPARMLVRELVKSLEDPAVLNDPLPCSVLTKALLAPALTLSEEQSILAASVESLLLNNAKRHPHQQRLLEAANKVPLPALLMPSSNTVSLPSPVMMASQAVGGPISNIRLHLLPSEMAARLPPSSPLASPRMFERSLSFGTMRTYLGESLASLTLDSEMQALSAEGPPSPFAFGPSLLSRIENGGTSPRID